MQTVRDILGKANYAYLKSTQKEELEKSALSLDALLQESWLNDANRENAEALLWRVRAKILALAYFEEGYNADDFAKLNAFAEEKSGEAERKGYANTAAVLQRLVSFASAADAVMHDAPAQADRVRTYDFQPATSSEAECREVSALFAKKEEAAKGLKELPSPFGEDVVFPNICDEMLEELGKVRSFAEGLAENIRLKDAEGFFEKHAKELKSTTPWQNCEYFPELPRGARSLANAVALCTPFADEAELFAVKNTEGCLYELRAEAFEGYSEENIENIFSLAASKGANVIIFGMERCRGDAEAVYRAAARLGKRGKKAFIADSAGDRKIYDAALKAVLAGGMQATDISFEYLSVPLFEETVALFEEKGMLQGRGEDYDFIRKDLPFMGFVGLNDAVSAFAAGKDWKQAAKVRSAENAPAARRYLEKLPSQGLLIDAGWGDFADDVKDDSRRAFDYDDIRTVSPENVRKIMEGDFTVFEKIGMLARYCTLAGDDSSRWAALSDELREERLREATRLVMRALGIEFEPEVAVLDELENKGAGGLCCDGGKRILYKKDCIQSYGWTIDCVCHECYHAFQHMVMYGPWRDWYWTDFGVTKGRKAEWLVNTGKKYFSGTSTAAYLVQVREAEARAFAADCLRDSERVWHTVDFD